MCTPDSLNGSHGAGFPAMCTQGGALATGPCSSNPLLGLFRTPARILLGHCNVNTINAGFTTRSLIKFAMIKKKGG